MNNQYELTNNMEDSFKLLRQAFMADQGPSDADPTTGTTSFLPPDQDSTFASGSSLSSLNDSPSYLNESYRLLRQAFTSGDGSVGLSTGATSAAESAAVVTGAKRTAPWTRTKVSRLYRNWWKIWLVPLILSCSDPICSILLVCWSPQGLLLQLPRLTVEPTGRLSSGSVQQ